MTSTSRDRAVPTPPSGPAGWFANRRVGTKILASLGVVEVTRREYLARLDVAVGGGVPLPEAFA